MASGIISNARMTPSDTLQATELSGTIPDAGALDQPRVLIVDDERDALETMDEIFTLLGFQTETASTGRQALQKLTSFQFEVALLDIHLQDPDMDGTRLLTEARRLQPDMKCIMVTGDESWEPALRSAELGAYWYLQKPISVPYVEAVVRRALDQRRLELEIRGVSRLARDLVEQEGLQERLTLILDYLLTATAVTRGAMWMVERNALRPAHAVGIEPEQKHRLMRAEVAFNELPPAILQALESGQARVIPDARLAGLLPEPLIERWGIKTALLLPFHSGGKLCGAALLSEPGRAKQFSDDQVRQAQTIAYLSAVAIQQAKTIQEERNTLSTLAESFLSVPPTIPGVEIARHYVPSFDVARVGGDYYDFLQLPGKRIGIVVGDVCGKGEAAIGYAFLAKHFLRAYALEDETPERVVTRLNSALYQQMSAMSEDANFSTIFYGVLDPATGEFTYTNAGHPRPILYNTHTGEVSELAPPPDDEPAPETKTRGWKRPKNGMVGAIDEMDFSQTSVVLEPGTVLTLFTDGVTEARTDFDMLGAEGVEDVVAAHGSEPAQAIADAILNRAREFCGGVLRDDVAIVVLKYG